MDMDTKKNHKKVNLTSSNLSEEKLAELRRILPEAFSEDKVDWNKLRAVLGDAIDERMEKFSFTWAGKSNAIKNVLIPSKATLRPAKDESVKFDESENLFIEGDNLEVLKLLQKAYFEQVKMIYIDPPYNTGGDFVYRDDFSAPLKSYLKQTGQVDGDGNHLQTNLETSGRYHSDWLSMMYPRLKLAWNLLRDDGVIFVSIDDNEVHHLRTIINEVFGEENFVAQFPWRKRTAKSDVPFGVSQDYEWILCFAKSNSFIASIEGSSRKYYESPDLPNRPWRIHDMTTQRTAAERPNSNFTIVDPKTGKKYPVNPNAVWRITKESFKEFYEDNRIVFPDDYDFLNISNPVLRYFKDEDESKDGEKFGYVPVSTNLPKQVGMTQDGTKDIAKLFNDKVFAFPKPVGLMQYLVKMSTSFDKSALILDFFAGSGTLAQAVLEQNKEDGGDRKFILVQFPEVTESESDAYQSGFKTIADIAKERIRRVIRGYGDNPQPIDGGFKVFKLSESNYPENAFEFDPAKSEEENRKEFESYLAKTKQAKLFDDTKALDVVYENIVKEGLSLNSKITQTKLGKNEVYEVSDGERRLLVCLDKRIADETVSELTGKGYKGTVFICLDNALDDTAKANLGLNVELKTI